MDKYQKACVEASKKLMLSLEKFFSNKHVVDIIMAEFPHKDALPVDALHVACCQIMIQVANADKNFSLAEEEIIKEITGFDVDPEKVKDFTCKYFVNGDGVPLIVGYACYIEEYYRRNKGITANAVEGLKRLFSHIISATSGADDEHDIRETIARLDIGMKIRPFFEEYERTHKAGYLVWAYDIK